MSDNETDIVDTNRTSGTTPKKHAGGRPRTKTPKSWTREQLAQIDAMAEAQCKDAHIAEVFGVDDKTFKGEFSERCRRKRAQGKAVVMLAQYEGCKVKGTGGMSERIWFGKQHLEQKDRTAIDHSGQIDTGHEPTEEEWQRFLAKHKAVETEQSPVK